jgi:hypothetical protein
MRRLLSRTLSGHFSWGESSGCILRTCAAAAHGCVCAGPDVGLSTGLTPSRLRAGIVGRGEERAAFHTPARGRIGLVSHRPSTQGRRLGLAQRWRAGLGRFVIAQVWSSGVADRTATHPHRQRRCNPPCRLLGPSAPRTASAHCDTLGTWPGCLLRPRRWQDRRCAGPCDPPREAAAPWSYRIAGRRTYLG